MNTSFIQKFKAVCWNTTKKKVLTSFVFIFVVFSCYNGIVLPTLDTWGATEEEIAMPLPGDSLVPVSLSGK